MKLIYQLRTVATAFALLGVCISAMAQIPNGYYDALKGKKGAALKSAVHDLIGKATVLDYGSGNRKTWWGFWQTDRTSDGRFIDRYSPENTWPQSTTMGKAGAGMNIEHSFPKSWWGGTENQAYKDLYNLMPSESGINSKKLNYPMGVVTDASIANNGATKVGTGSDGKKYWEPADEWKGDFARGYMYMATCYQDFSWTGVGLQILQNNTYPTLQEWAYKLYIQWAKADKPNLLEVTRNNAVSKIQGNRNPFVDFPNLMDYIWGDSVNYAFDPMTAECSEKYFGDNTPITPGDMQEDICSWNFTKTDGGFTSETAVQPTSVNEVWMRDSKYGWMATAFDVTAKSSTSDATLVSPEIDLTNYSSATLSFKHALNYIKQDNIAERLSVTVRCDGQETPITNFVQWPSGTNWTPVESGEISLNEFAGKKIHIAFRYTSTDDNASTWEIFSMYLTGNKSTSGISNASVNAKGFNPNETFETFTIDGKSINGCDKANGIVIVKQNGKTWKMTK